MTVNEKQQVFYESNKLDETQASRVIKIFGGAYSLSQSLKAIGCNKNLSSIYRWTYPRSKGGTDGVIPTAVWPYILKASRYEGIFLEDELISPRESVLRKKHIVFKRHEKTGKLKKYKKRCVYDGKGTRRFKYGG